MLLYLIKQKKQNYNDIKQLALLYFEGKANCEEEAKVFDFIAESAEQKRMFVQWEDEWEREHIPDQRTEDAWNELIRKMKLKETEQKEKAE